MKSQFIIKWLITLTLLYTGWCGVLYAFQESFLFFPSSEHAVYPVFKDVKWEEVNFQTSDGETINAFWMNNGEKETVLFFHGNAGNISHRAAQLLVFKRLEKDVLMIDYRGYGKSSGEIRSEKNVYLDGEAALKFLAEKNISIENIILWGKSIGTGVATHLAQNHNFRALVLEAPFASLTQSARFHYPFLPVEWLLKYKFENGKKIKNITAPVLIFHSREDEVVPFAQGENLFAAANEPKTFQEVSGKHDEILRRSTQKYLDTLKEFFSDK